jgi:adenylate cyclase
MMKSTLDKAMVRYEHQGRWYRGAYKKLPLAGLGVIYTIEEEKAFARVRDIRNRNLYILGIVLSLAILAGYFFARSLALPLRELVGATRRVENEDYTVTVEPRSGDEVGVLAASFNKMVKGLAERERMKDAFGRFVNREVAERALRGEIKLGGEKKECAIFFSDLRGFTAMSEKLQPEEVVEYLNRYFTLMVDCVDKTHGVVDKFIGDAVMATWGAVISHGNDTANAIDGALMMRRALIEFNKYNAEHGLPIAKFGCGINTGPVISGQIGSEKKLEFTVIGDAVNLASRIESLNKPFATDILISQDAFERVADLFDVVKMPAIKVKGKSEPQTIYCVLGRKDDPDRPKNLEELRKLTGIDWEAKAEKSAVIEEEKEEKYEIIEG